MGNLIAGSRFTIAEIPADVFVIIGNAAAIIKARSGPEFGSESVNLGHNGSRESSIREALFFVRLNVNGNRSCRNRALIVSYSNGIGGSLLRGNRNLGSGFAGAPLVGGDGAVRISGTGSIKDYGGARSHLFGAAGNHCLRSLVSGVQRFRDAVGELGAVHRGILHGTYSEVAAAGGLVPAISAVIEKELNAGSVAVKAEILLVPALSGIVHLHSRRSCPVGFSSRSAAIVDAHLGKPLDGRLEVDGGIVRDVRRSSFGYRTVLGNGVNALGETLAVSGRIEGVFAVVMNSDIGAAGVTGIGDGSLEVAGTLNIVHGQGTPGPGAGILVIKIY